MLSGNNLAELRLNTSHADFVQFLDEISMWHVHRDFDRWRQRVILPFTSVTPRGQVVMETQTALWTDFQHHLTAADIMGLNMIVRRPVTLEECDDGTWLGTYETRLISNGQLVLDPYVSTALMAWDDGVLKMSSVMNARGHTPWTGVTTA